MAPRRPPPASSPEPHHGVEQLARYVTRLERCATEVDALDPASVRKRYGVPEVMAIEAGIEEALAGAFGHGTPAYNRYVGAATLDNGPRSVQMASSFGPRIDYEAKAAMEAPRYIAEGKKRSIALINGAIRSLQDQIADRQAAAPTKSVLPSVKTDASRKVFVVHGRDDTAKNEVALFLTKIGLEPIILHERPNKGRHLLTKFQEESEGAGFAIVLMTPDDEGGLKAILGTTETKAPTNPRARQNVVFELGFFIGKLGPANVAALMKNEVERPSDFDGVAYIALDSGGAWKSLLARELHAAEVPFDASKVFGA